MSAWGHMLNIDPNLESVRSPMQCMRFGSSFQIASAIALVSLDQISYEAQHNEWMVDNMLA
jgi:hypothetical protein